MICGGGGSIVAIAADRSEMALVRAILSTASGRFAGAGIMEFAVVKEILTAAFLG